MEEKRETEGMGMSMGEDKGRREGQEKRERIEMNERDRQGEEG